ncbi:MAG: transposase [Phycisphaerales bacterium]|nr:transposase [Phycisphaerales bacterium]
MNVYLQRDRYQRQGGFRGYRNGTTPRRLTLGSGTVPLEVPGCATSRRAEPFESKIVRYQRRSDTIEETFMRLFIEGLRRGTSSGLAAAGERRRRPARSVGCTAVPRRVRGVRPEDRAAGSSSISGRTGFT